MAIINGSYGEIFRNDNIITKITDLYMYGGVSDVNFSELCFLKSYSEYNKSVLHNQFPNLIGCSINSKNKIVILQKYHGITLYTHLNQKTFQERLNLLENYMFQFLIFLGKMEKINIVHMDIKPANVCVDEENNLLTFIDFGFIGMKNNCAEQYHGTNEYADPNYLGYNMKPDFSYDMFSSGLTLLTFLLKTNISKTIMMDYYRNSETFTNDNFIKVSGLLSLREFILKLENGNFLYEILEKMIDVNHESRFKPKEIYKYIYKHKTFIKQYVGFKIELNVNNEFLKIKPTENNISKYKQIIINTIKSNKYTFKNFNLLLIPTAIQMLNDYINKFPKEVKIDDTKEIKEETYTYSNNIDLYFYSMMNIQCSTSSKDLNIFDENINYLTVKITNTYENLYIEPDLFNLENKYTNYIKVNKNQYVDVFISQFINDLDISKLISNIKSFTEWKTTPNMFNLSNI